MLTLDQQIHIFYEVQRRPPDQVAYCLTHFDRCCNDVDITDGFNKDN